MGLLIFFAIIILGTIAIPILLGWIGLFISFFIPDPNFEERQRQEKATFEYQQQLKKLQEEQEFEHWLKTRKKHQDENYSGIDPFKVLG